MKLILIIFLLVYFKPFLFWKLLMYTYSEILIISLRSIFSVYTFLLPLIRKKYIIISAFMEFERNLKAVKHWWVSFGMVINDNNLIWYFYFQTKIVQYNSIKTRIGFLAKVCNVKYIIAIYQMVNSSKKDKVYQVLTQNTKINVWV